MGTVSSITRLLVSRWFCPFNVKMLEYVFPCEVTFWDLSCLLPNFLTILLIQHWLPTYTLLSLASSTPSTVEMSWDKVKLWTTNDPQQYHEIRLPSVSPQVATNSPGVLPILWTLYAVDVIPGKKCIIIPPSLRPKTLVVLPSSHKVVTTTTAHTHSRLLARHHTSHHQLMWKLLPLQLWHPHNPEPTLPNYTCGIPLQCMC